MFDSIFLTSLLKPPVFTVLSTLGVPTFSVHRPLQGHMWDHRISKTKLPDTFTLRVHFITTSQCRKRELLVFFRTGVSFFSYKVRKETYIFLLFVCFQTWNLQTLDFPEVDYYIKVFHNPIRNPVLPFRVLQSLSFIQTSYSVFFSSPKLKNNKKYRCKITQRLQTFLCL